MPNSPNGLSHCIYYAIGDVHGEVDRLVALHETIFAYHRRHWPDSKQIVVHLGDYIDRGPDPCATVEVLIGLEELAIRDTSLDVVCLKGNHEQIMLDALDDPEGAMMRTWRRQAYGGQETLASYERRGGRGDLIRDLHRQWFEGLPTIWRPEGTPYVFVHAGVDPILFPLEDDEVYIWTRSADFFDTSQWRSHQLNDAVVIHGHTPTHGKPEVTADGRRINVDTGAVYGGSLTCAVLVPGRTDVTFLEA